MVHRERLLQRRLLSRQRDDGKVGWSELKRYLKKKVTRLARRYYGRDRTAKVVVGKGG